MPMKSSTKSQINDHLHWYKDAIIYELHIKAFMDENGDGIGDFKGLIGKLDYLEQLGVTAIWLLPFYPSPLKDDGYDIMDYYNINPSYGKIRHFKKFVKQAHERGIRVITELVINHTSDEHPWFKRARKAPEGSVERDYYVWSDDPNKYKGVRIIFQDYETSNWAYDPVAKSYYWHRFFHHQPDLNYDNPKVQEEVFQILEFWLKMGVDGFRLDAVPYLYQREGTNCENLPETHAFLKKLRAFVDKKYPGTLLLAEANMWPEDSAAYFGDGDECQMNYHFPIMPRMFMAMRMEDRYPITDIFDQTPEIPETCQWGIFLRNHDELTLEMVTDEERDYMYKVYAQNPKARINLGLRRRLAPLMDNNRKKIELINCLLFSLPGTPVIYYGDEIGMGDNYYLGDRDGVRTPMQWSPDRNAGFSKTNPQELYLPVIHDPEYHFGTVNVETQQNNPTSLLWWMKRFINMRKQHMAFSRGDMQFLHSENHKILAFTRTYESETILIIVNLSRHAQAVNLDLSAHAGAVPVEVFSKNEFPVISAHQDYFFTMSSHAYHWLLLTNENEPGKEIRPLAFDTIEALVEGENLRMLERKVLPAYLMRSRWFDGRDKGIQELKIIHHNKVSDYHAGAMVLIVEVQYATGLPDHYQLGLGFARDNTPANTADKIPRSVICPGLYDGKPGMIFDALYKEHFQIKVFEWLANNRKVKNGAGYLEYSSDNAVKRYFNQKKDLKARILTTRDTNTSLIYNQDYYLKLYRKLDKDINADLEINRYLNQAGGFPHVPKLMGNYQYYEGDKSIVLGMLQSAVDYQQEAGTYFADHVDRYYELVLSSGHLNDLPKLKGQWLDPVNDQTTDHATFLDAYSSLVAEQMRLLGLRTASLHNYLGQDTDWPNFQPEPFSLHYQRSLFSQYQTLVRSTFQKLNKVVRKLPDDLQPQLLSIYAMKNEILKRMKMVYAEPFDILKIRTHGDFHLDQVLFTGQDFVFIDFEGDPKKSYSQRRLKKSPLRDIVTMIRSIHRLTYRVLLHNENIKGEDSAALMTWASNWYQYSTRCFLTAYLEGIKESQFIPKDKDQLEVLLNTFLMEQALIELHEELTHPSKDLISPMLEISHQLGIEDLSTPND